MPVRDKRTRQLRYETMEDDLTYAKEELDNLENLPPPDVIAAEIVDNLEAALEQFQAVAEELG